MSSPDFMPVPSRPVVLTQEELEKCVEMAAKGLAFRDMAQILNLSLTAFFEYRKAHPRFEHKLNQLREDSTHDAVDSVLKIVSDDTRDFRVTRNILEATKFVSAVKNRKDYGSRVDINVTKTIDLGQELRDAFARTSQLVDITPQNQILAPDTESEQVKQRLAFEDLL